jgi:hypothetical protein
MKPLRGKVQKRIGRPAARENAASAAGVPAFRLLKGMNLVIGHEKLLTSRCFDQAAVSRTGGCSSE